MQIQQTADALLDLGNVTFGAGWSASRDRAIVLDTARSNTIRSTSLTDWIVLMGGHDPWTAGGHRHPGTRLPILVRRHWPD